MRPPAGLRGAGRTFTVDMEFVLPEQEEEPQAEAAAEDTERGLVGKRLPAAEDNEISAEILGEIPELEGIRYDPAQDGKEAVELFLNSAPDLKQPPDRPDSEGPPCPAEMS